MSTLPILETLEQARARTAHAACDGCEKNGTLSVHLVQKEGPNQGRVFAKCRQLGLHLVAHAGEEGPPEYVWAALDVLHVERVDHGVQSAKDPALMTRLAKDRIPLTVCPLSNLKLCVFPQLADHNLRQLLDAGLMATVNSDDPAYFGGYVGDNYVETAKALGLGREEMLALARNSLEAAFVSKDAKASWVAALEGFR